MVCTATAPRPSCSRICMMTDHCRAAPVIERWRVVPVHSMKAHACWRLMRTYHIEKLTDTIHIERLDLRTELSLQKPGVDEYCVW
jgi:hypothetical protein